MSGTEGQGDGTVASLRGLRVVRSAPILEAAWRYWSAERPGAGLPRRTALDPKAMTRFLGHSMILDRTPGGTIRIRLGGAALNTLMGMEVRSLPVRAFFDIGDRAAVLDRLDAVFTAPATLELDLIAEGEASLVTARMIVLPLLDAAGEPTKALAVLVADRPVTEAPCRFRLTRDVLVPLDGAQANEPAPERDPRPRRRRTDYQLPVEITAGFAEPQTPYEAKPATDRTTVPWLRVVK
ncbi:PAS domain-containing protein [Jannaschia marina]|uniref:PAS domain-containing protein n=1 Tax=Jannaschia marina TaxID=2741674 RepID=UPI0015CCF04F|nr:PAS domain-containing protein [Jannaschia marina]